MSKEPNNKTQVNIWTAVLDWITIHSKKIIIGFTILIVISPLAVWLIYALGNAIGGIPTKITADGMVGYVATIISALATILISCVALRQTNIANQLATDANDLNKRLMKLEEDSQNRDLRPFVVVSDWAAYPKRYIDILQNPDKLYINVSSDSNSDIKGYVSFVCIQMTFVNATDWTIMARYKEGRTLGSAGKAWSNSRPNQHNDKLLIKASEKADIVFYAESGFFSTADDITIKLTLENRFGEYYEEEFSFTIRRLDKLNEKEYYLDLGTSDYKIGKFDKEANLIPEN